MVSLNVLDKVRTRWIDSNTVSPTPNALVLGVPPPNSALTDYARKWAPLSSPAHLSTKITLESKAVSALSAG